MTNDKDLVEVLRGDYPVVTIAGYNCYLNVMEGLECQWKFTWEQDYLLVNSGAYKAKFE